MSALVYLLIGSLAMIVVSKVRLYYMLNGRTWIATRFGYANSTIEVIVHQLLVLYLWPLAVLWWMNWSLFDD